MDEFYELTGRRYRRVSTYKMDDAEYVILGQGSMIVTAEAVADYLRETRKLKVGVVNLTMFRPFPGDLLGEILKGRKGVAVLERVDQPLAEDLPLMREVRAAHQPVRGKRRASPTARLPYPDYAVYSRPDDMPPLYSGSYGLGSPRPAAGRADRRDREHAAQGRSHEASSISRSISCATSRSLPSRKSTRSGGRCLSAA